MAATCTYKFFSTGGKSPEFSAWIFGSSFFPRNRLASSKYPNFDKSSVSSPATDSSSDAPDSSL